MTDSFPRQQARTRRFTLGVPRSFQISPDGARIAFLRSKGGTDPVTCLWVMDAGSAAERLVADPAAIAATGGDLPAEEKARRERSREQAGGIVAFATDAGLTMAAFALAGQVHVASLTGMSGGATPAPRPAGARCPAVDPRPDPSGTRVAYVCEGALRITDLGSGEDRELIGPGGSPGVTFGLAEFIAAEEMGRLRGYWWAPDGTALLVARVDETGINQWHVADPADPARPPARVPYPAAGTPNADVSLVLARLDGGRIPVEWDRSRFCYLVTVDWEEGGPLIVVQSRDQRTVRILAVDPASGATTVIREDNDPHWLDIVPGVPARSGGRIVWTAVSGGARRLLAATPADLAAGRAGPVTPAGLQVREVLDVDDDAVLFTATQDDPAGIGVWLHRPGGLTCLTPGGGVHGGRRGGGVTVIVSRGLDEDGVTVRVLRDGPGPPGGGAPGSGTGAAEVARIASLASRPELPTPRPDLFTGGPRRLRCALLLPSWHEPGSGKLPVLLDPYGGPHAQRVLAARGAFLTSQWLAEQGFAVLVADGRGTPGRGPDWERAVAGDLAGPVLADQIDALHAAGERWPDLDLDRVAIRGWSFGGYLAALAVLRRPDVFHAAVAGAPVTDWHLYDTHYTERYLGHPDEHGADYDACSLLGEAHGLSRPLLLIHGLADDNVVAAHTLRLSSALLAAGRPHCVLPLPGVTHMTVQEEVAENLLLLQAGFLRRALGLPPAPGLPTAP